MAQSVDTSTGVSHDEGRRHGSGQEAHRGPRRRWWWIAAGVLVGGALAVAAGFVAPSLVILGFFVLLALAFGARARWDAVSILTLYVVLLFALPARFILAPLGAGGTPAAVVGFGAAILWLLSRVFRRLGGWFGPSPMRAVMLLFVGSVFAAYAAAASQRRDVAEALSADRGLFLAVSMAGGGLLLVDGVRNRWRLDLLLQRLTLAGTLLGVLGVFQHVAAVDITPWLQLPGLTVSGDAGFVFTRINVRRVAGTMLHPIEFGVVLAALIPLAAHYAFLKWDRRPGLGALMPLAVIGVAIPLSVSRSAYLAAFVALALIFPTWTPRQRVWALITAPFAVLAMSAVFPGVLGTIRGLVLGFSEDPSVQARTEDYARIPGVMEGFLWFGRGFRTFVPDRYFLLDNQWLMSLIETGVVGFVVMLSIFAAAAFVSSRIRWTSPHLQDRNLARALFASLAAIGVSFATFDGLSFPTIAGVMFILAGALGALWKLNVEESRGGAVGR